jgi:hypothetical protein
MLLRLASAVLLTVVLLAVLLLARAAAGASQQWRAAKQPAAAVSEAATVRPAGQADAMAQPATRTCSVAMPARHATSLHRSCPPGGVNLRITNRNDGRKRCDARDDGDEYLIHFCVAQK